MICVWEKIIIPEIKNINIVITELYNRIHYLSILLDQHLNLILLHLPLEYALLNNILFNKNLYKGYL